MGNNNTINKTKDNATFSDSVTKEHDKEQDGSIPQLNESKVIPQTTSPSESAPPGVTSPPWQDVNYEEFDFNDDPDCQGDYCIRETKEVIHKVAVNLVEAGLDDIEVDVTDGTKDMAEYCLLLLGSRFKGQTSKSSEKDTDENDDKDVLNLGMCLSLLDKYLKRFTKVSDITGNEDDFKVLLWLIARKRHRDDKCETPDDCYNNLIEQSKRFIKIYHERNEPSETLGSHKYWGTKQQLLAGKVIADHVDRENGPLDPIFGVLLQPTAGRVGPGDSGWVHGMLFDDSKHMAYHSAVHDAFGYLMNNHGTGPGYDYMKGSTWFKTTNPLAGQTPGIAFWKKAIENIHTKKKVLKKWMI